MSVSYSYDISSELELLSFKCLHLGSLDIFVFPYFLNFLLYTILVFGNILWTVITGRRDGRKDIQTLPIQDMQTTPIQDIQTIPIHVMQTCTLLAVITRCFSAHTSSASISDG